MKKKTIINQTMKLSVMERLLLLNILPTKGTILKLRLAREFSEELSFTEEEHKKLNFVENEGSVTWNDNVENTVKEIKIGKVMRELIKDELTKLEEKENLGVEHVDLYGKFFD
jgi:predicted NUDIX family phosphoesterase